MPLFKRADGDLITDETRVRRMLPYLMRGRNESAVYHEQVYDLTRLRPWLKAYNQCHDQAATMFHLLLYAFGCGLHERPGMNRFVSGGRLYQRKKAQLSFAAKRRMTDDSPLVTVKLDFRREESFTTWVRRVVAAIETGRGDGISMVDRELALALALPAFVLRIVMAILRWLDRANLLPGALIESDPLYSSIFVANLGSVGLDRTFHHLYEWGTISLFAVIGAQRKVPVADRAGRIEVRDTIQVRWAFDERIHDGFYCAASMRVAQRMIEDPEKYFGPPSADADALRTLPAAAGGNGAAVL